MIRPAINYLKARLIQRESTMKLNFTITGSTKSKYPLLRTAIALRDLAERLLYLENKYSFDKLSKELPLEFPVNVLGATLLIKMEKGNNGN